MYQHGNRRGITIAGKKCLMLCEEAHTLHAHARKFSQMKWQRRAPIRTKIQTTMLRNIITVCNLVRSGGRKSLRVKLQRWFAKYKQMQK